MSSIERYSQFEFITYPESMGDIYVKLDNAGYQAVRSPLHDSDVNEETGEIKKAHYHNMIILSSLKSAKQINEICTTLGISHWEKVYDRRAKLRYYCHLDSKKKAHYNYQDVLCFGGFDYNSVLDKADKHNPHVDFISYLKTKEFRSFRKLVNTVAEEKPEFLQLLIDRSYFYYQYVKTNK